MAWYLTFVQLPQSWESLRVSLKLRNTGYHPYPSSWVKENLMACMISADKCRWQLNGSHLPPHKEGSIKNMAKEWKLYCLKIRRVQSCYYAAVPHVCSSSSSTAPAPLNGARQHWPFSAILCQSSTDNGRPKQIWKGQNLSAHLCRACSSLAS